MNKYIRTKKGEILDLENIKLEIIDNELYYKDFVFEEIKQDGNDIRLDYSAIGTIENCLEGQKGKRCKFALVSYNDEILKQSDTIEELCDELVLKDLDTNFCFVMNANHIKDIKDNWQNLMDNEYLKNHIIYGAIWADKGLVYVAKMNDKGELELCLKK